MTKYMLEPNRDGGLALLNRADGTLVGFVSGVVTQSRYYSFTSFNDEYIRNAQIYAGEHGLRAYGTYTETRKDVPNVEDERLTSSIRSIAIIPPAGGELFEVQAQDVAATPYLILSATNGHVSINGDYAATILGNQAEIDAEGERLLHIHYNGINSRMDMARMRDAMIVAPNMLV